MSKNDADLGRVVTVAVSLAGSSIQRDNMNIVSVFASQLIPNVFDSNHRQLSFLNPKAVAETFGTNSKAYQHALAFFGQSPNPTTVDGGRLVFSYWRAVEEAIAATSGNLTGAQLSEAKVIGELQSFNDLSFDVEVDGNSQSVTGVNGQILTSLAELATTLNNSITGAAVTIVDQKLIITSLTTGASSAVGFFTEGTVGTFIGDIIGLATGTGAISTGGKDAETLSAETKLEAVNQATDFKFKGFLFVDNPTDIETAALSAYAQANDKLYYDVFDSANNLLIDTTNICWSTKLSKYTNTRMLFDKAGDRKFATRYMSRAHTVDFNGDSSAITMQLKELAGQIPQSYNDTELDKMDEIGLDTYVTFKDEPAILCSNGSNGYTDLSYGILALKDAIQVSAFNLLKTTPTKVPQTQTGVNQLLDTLKKTCEQFKKAGFIGEGTWNNSYFFGDLETFKRNILQKGYYIKIQSLADQTQADREQRKSPLVQIAVKTAGAFHSVNILLNIEE